MTAKIDRRQRRQQREERRRERAEQEYGNVAPPGFADPGKGELTGLATHFALEVTDLRALKTHLEHHGANIVSGPLMRGDGAEQLYVHDPDGYLIEFFEWTGVGKQDAPERAAVRD